MRYFFVQPLKELIDELRGRKEKKVEKDVEEGEVEEETESGSICAIS